MTSGIKQESGDHQQAVIDYLIEENRVLKNQLEGRRFRSPFFCAVRP